MAQQTTAVGADQCRQFLKGLLPKGDNRELWIKFGHDSFYRAEWDENGNLSGIATVLADKGDPYSREIKGRPIPDLIKHLEARAKKEDGGVFYVPTQPTGYPTAECVTETDDIGIEIDHLPLDEQKSLIALFTQVTGLEFSSVLTSGGASIHAHLKMDDHYPVEEMHQWRRLAIIAFQSDPVTERLHQPMRMPGFYRKEKDAYQELLSSSDRRYSHAQLSEGFDLWFEYRGWVCPPGVSEQWFKESWFQLLNSQNPASPALKASQTQKYLAEGNDAYIARRAAESEASAAERKPITDVTGEKISDVVEGVCDRASVSDFGGVDWQGQGGHYRGQCPFHSGKTGNSAWLSDKLGGFKFHCVSCTNDQPRSSFEYWVARQGIAGIEDATLKGKDYVKAVEMFLGQYGLVLPKKAETNGHSKPEINRHSKPETNGHDETKTLDTKSLEVEFEETKNKRNLALERVEKITEELENCPEENRKGLETRLRNAKDILKAINSIQFNRRLEIKRLSITEKEEVKTGFAKDFVVILEKVADRLSYNLLDKSIYIDDERTQFNSASLWLSEKTGHINWNKGDSTLSLLILDLAKKNEFCPVKRYLENIQTKVAHSFLDQCVPFLFGVLDTFDEYPLVLAAFKAQMVGSVRRVYEPGCHHRIMPILFGQQKKGKSTFLRHLYGEFGSAGMLPMADKDGAMIIQRCWAHEVDECDKLFKTREASSLKSFVALTSDTFRAPYERDTLSHPRRSVLWGTTNHQALFSDPTGNTRYPVIPIPDGFAIPTDWVKANRDNIWAAALDAYWTGISNEIPAELEQAIAEDAENYSDKDALYEPIEAILAGILPGDSITLMEVGEKLGFDTSNFDKLSQNRVTSILRKLGYENRPVWYAGKKARRWSKANSP